MTLISLIIAAGYLFLLAKRAKTQTLRAPMLVRINSNANNTTLP
jgi:hypothetical protein